jgi:cytochrome c oxidase subunit 2
MEVNVVGKRWMWKTQHMTGQREINELHVPAGQDVRLVMASQDVIHSFFVPALRVKQDVVPGRYESLWFRADRRGRYHLFCAEYCGTDHSRMGGWLTVMEPRAFAGWLNDNGGQGTLAEQGASLFRTYGCSGCHEPGGTVRAPPLEGLYGNPVPLSDGRVIRADESYVRDSILLPKSDVAAGYDPVMPSFAGQVSEEDLAKLVAYIQSLGTSAPPAAGRP